MNISFKATKYSSAPDLGCPKKLENQEKDELLLFSPDGISPSESRLVTIYKSNHDRYEYLFQLKFQTNNNLPMSTACSFGFFEVVSKTALFKK